MARRCARSASFGKWLPNVTPGSDVLTTPNIVRTVSAASCFGSHVSCCGGPPPSQSHTTDLPRTHDLSLAELPRSKSGTPSAPSPSAPNCKKARRELVLARMVNIVISKDSVFSAEAARSRIVSKERKSLSIANQFESCEPLRKSSRELGRIYTTNSLIGSRSSRMSILRPALLRNDCAGSMPRRS